MSSDDATYSRNPAAKPPTKAAARDVALARAAILATAIGGIGGPWLFGVLIGSGESVAIAWGYALGALLMMTAAAVAFWLGVAAECKPLEQVARPLSCVDAVD